MARKKAPSGRSRGITLKSKIKRSPMELRLIRTVEKANKALVDLERNHYIGTYASRRLMERASKSTFKYNPKSKIKFKFKKDPSRMTSQEQLLHIKTFEKFLKSPTSSSKGMKVAKGEVKERVKRSLGEIVERKLTDEDVEDFYDMMYDEDVFGYFTQYIKPSDLYALIDEAKESNWGEDRFIAALEQFITINIEETRIKAKRLYEKYVL